MYSIISLVLILKLIWEITFLNLIFSCGESRTVNIQTCLINQDAHTNQFKIKSVQLNKMQLNTLHL